MRPRPPRRSPRAPTSQPRWREPQAGGGVGRHGVAAQRPDIAAGHDGVVQACGPGAAVQGSRTDPRSDDGRARRWSHTFVSSALVVHCFTRSTAESVRGHRPVGAKIKHTSNNTAHLHRRACGRRSPGSARISAPGATSRQLLDNIARIVLGRPEPKLAGIAGGKFPKCKAGICSSTLGKFGTFCQRRPV